MRAAGVGIVIALASVAHAAANLPGVSGLEPGQTLRLSAGRIGRPLVLKGLRGEKGKPIRIVAEDGAVLDGTRRIEAKWRPWRDGIWRAA